VFLGIAHFQFSCKFKRFVQQLKTINNYKHKKATEMAVKNKIKLSKLLKFSKIRLKCND